ncbi:MAG: hypothetical protein JJ855_19670 [Rhodospirillales bacterium]|nr:hypothetical protein [Rhodospirillales bacterium]
MIERFPNEFVAIHETNLSKPISYGFTVGAGWRKIIEAAVIALSKRNRISLRGELRIEEVTTRNGALSIIVSHSDERVQGILAAAEMMSALVCEACGNPGSPSLGSIAVRCNEHRRKAACDPERLITIFNAHVREGVADPAILATLENHEEEVRQCAVTLAYFIGTARGVVAEDRGIQPRLTGFQVSDDHLFSPWFEFSPGEQLKGVVEFCRSYVKQCQRSRIASGEDAGRLKLADPTEARSTQQEVGALFRPVIGQTGLSIASFLTLVCALGLLIDAIASRFR